jgi:hypothetical protein
MTPQLIDYGVVSNAFIEQRREVASDWWNPGKLAKERDNGFGERIVFDLENDRSDR